MIKLKLSQNRNYVKCNKKSVLFVKLEISVDQSTQIIPKQKHVALVIDRSGSMYGEKIEEAKRAAMDIVRTLSPNDLVSIVTFDSVAEVKLNPTPASDNNIENVIRSIDVGATTALHDGISMGFQLLQQASRPNMINALYVFSDGEPNVPIEHATDDNGNPIDKARRDGDFMQQSRAIRNQGMTQHVFGIGDDYNGPLLMLLAECGGGKWQHVADPNQLTTVVNTQIKAMQNTVILNPQLQLTLMNGAELNNVSITEPTLEEIDTKTLPKSGNTISIGLKDIIKGESQTVAMRIAVPPIEGENISLLTAAITEGNNVVVEQTASLSCTDDKDLYNQEDDPNPRILLSTSEATVLLGKGAYGDTEAQQKATIILENIKETDTDLLSEETSATVINARVISGEIKPGMSESEKKRVLHETTIVGQAKNLTCPNCNSPIRATSKICGKCGKPINKNEVDN